MKSQPLSVFVQLMSPIVNSSHVDEGLKLTEHTCVSPAGKTSVDQHQNRLAVSPLTSSLYAKLS